MKVGLVGYGLAGSVFHAPIIQKSSKVELFAIVSSQQELIKENFPKVHVYSSIEKMLLSDIDLVVIATPNQLHYEQAKLALLANKHVVVEKPMTSHLSQAQELAKIANSRGKKINVFHNRRFDGDYMTLKRLIREEQIGRVHYFESNFNRFRPSVDHQNWRETTDYAGGIFYDLAPHLIDQAVDLFGPPEKVFLDKRVARSEAQQDDDFHLVFFYSDLRVHLNASALTCDTRERFIVHSDKLTIKSYGFDPQEKNLKNKNFQDFGKYKKSMQMIEGDETKRISILDGDYTKFYDSLVDMIQGNSLNGITLDQSLMVMELMDLSVRSYQEQRVMEYISDLV